MENKVAPLPQTWQDYGFKNAFEMLFGAYVSDEPVYAILANGVKHTVYVLSATPETFTVTLDGNPEPVTLLEGDVEWASRIV